MLSCWHLHGTLGSLRRMRAACAVVAAALLLSFAGSASAADEDTIFLTNGGRVRGTIMVEEPGKGVTIKLADGTTRVLKSSEVLRVEYAQSAAAAPAAAAPVAPALAPAPPAYAPPPPGYAPYPQSGAGASPDRPSGGTHRRTGLLVTGIVLMGAGIIALPAGGGLFASSHGAIDCSSSYYNGSYTEYSYATCDDSGMQAAGIGLMIGGGVVLAAGIPLFILGLIKVRDKPDDAKVAPASADPRSWAFAPIVLGNRGYGIAVAGAL
jgi:hypothetical protein